MRLLRWSAALAVAETYQLEGFDAVVAEDALGDRLEDFLDLVEPEPVHVVVVRRRAPTRPRRGGASGSTAPTSGPTSRASPRTSWRTSTSRACSRRRPPDTATPAHDDRKSIPSRLEADGMLFRCRGLAVRRGRS